jgi:signal transduction histidine kinase
VECPLERTLATIAPASGEVSDAGRSRIFDLNTFPLESETGEFSGCIQIAKDITEKREGEIRLIVSERLAAVGQLAAGVAHEINNPLATISGCAEGLLSRIDQAYDPRGTKEYLEIIKEEVLRCKSITDGMLSFVRQANYDIKTVCLDDVLERSIEMVRLQGRLHNVQMVRDYAPDLPPVRVRPGDLMQVFLSLFSNALDAIEDRGFIHLRTGTQDGKVFAEVRDTGPGVPAEHAEKIFDLFFTTKSTKGGTGIGLPIARKLVWAMSGQLTLESGLESGATFRVVLPAGEPNPAEGT